MENKNKKNNQKMENKNEKSNNKKVFIALGILLVILSIIVGASLVSAVIVDDVNQGTLYPGNQASLDITLKNNLDYDVEDLSFNLVFTNPLSTSTTAQLFTPVGTSERTLTELNEDRSKTLSFDVKASNSIEPGDYSLGYVLTYKPENNSTIVTKTGTIGITVNSKTQLDFIALTDKPIIGQEGKLSLKIINKGFGEIKFVSVKIQPDGYNLLSEDNVYIGSIASDDFQTADYTVVYTKKNPTLTATVTYKDFENNDRVANVNLDVRAYTQEEAIKLGLITPSRTPYIVAVVIIVVLFFVIRGILKRRKKKKALNNSNGRS